MSTFQTAFQADASPALDDAFGWPAVYQRGAHSVALTVMFDQHIQTSMGAKGAFFEVRSMQFLIAAADLILDSVTVLPARGDRLLLNDLSGNQRTYEVAPEGNAPTHSWNDQAHHKLRIPMVLVATGTTTTTAAP